MGCLCMHQEVVTFEQWKPWGVTNWSASFWEHKQRQPPARQRFPGGIERQEREGRNARPKRRERSASLSSKTHNRAPGLESVVFGGTWSMLVGMTLVCLIGMGLCMVGLTTADGFPRSSLLGSSVRFGTEWSTSITNSQRVRAGIPSMRKLASREVIAASVELCETEVCFFAHPTSWHKRVTSENAQDPSWCWFWVFKVSCKIRALKQSKSALLCCVSHITTLPAFTCMMNVRDQTRQAFVRRFLSTLWPHKQDCSQTTKYQVSQYEPNTDITEQFVSKLLTLLQQIPLLLLP